MPGARGATISASPGGAAGHHGNGFPDLAVGAIYDDTAQGSNAGSVVLVDRGAGATTGS